jgi:hypothetical protein
VTCYCPLSNRSCDNMKTKTKKSSAPLHTATTGNVLCFSPCPHLLTPPHIPISRHQPKAVQTACQRWKCPLFLESSWLASCSSVGSKEVRGLDGTLTWFLDTRKRWSQNRRLSNPSLPAKDPASIYCLSRRAATGPTRTREC